MIYGNGIDLVEIDRIEKVYKRYGERFLSRFFSSAEIKIIRRRPAVFTASLAGRFAAKEAVIKAMSPICDRTVFPADIEILSGSRGEPLVRAAEHLNKCLAGKKIMISITHENKFAAAVAVITDEA